MAQQRAWQVTNFSAFVLLLMTGCGSLPHSAASRHGLGTLTNASELMSQHIIEVDDRGFLLDLRAKNKSPAITNREEATEYLRTNIFETFQNSRQRKMMVFVHGGLNDREEGLAHFSDDYGAVTNGEYYPIFVVWPSGWKTTYLEHLFWVRQGIRAETLNEKTFSFLTSPLMFLADLGRALTRLPMVVANNSKSDFETVVPIRNREGGAAVQQYQQLVAEDYPVSIGDDYSMTSDRAIRDVTYWATLPVKYLLSSFIDGLGKGAWDNMMRRTQQVYPAKSDARSIDWMNRLRQTNEVSAPQATRRPMTAQQQKRAQRYAAAGLPVFIENLWSSGPGAAKPEVTLVGHSMGAIILNRLLRDAGPGMEYTNIVYMGAACSIEDFSRTVLPYMEKHPQTQFYSLSLHPVAEAGEWYPWMADVPPRGSLLVWIDNFLSNPVTEQERTMGRWRNLFRSGATGEPVIHRFFAEDGPRNLKSRLHFQAFSVGLGDKQQLRKTTFQWNEHPVRKDACERADNPLSHGEFTEMPYWKPEFWWQPNLAGGKAHQVSDGGKNDRP